MSAGAALAVDRPIASQMRIFMDTGVTIEVWPPGDGETARAAISRAFNWFRLVEATCSRFDPDSELARLSATCGEAVPVSPLLLEVLDFALAVAEASEGAFDPTVGDAMVRAGFSRRYVDGAESTARGADGDASYRDVSVDRTHGTVALRVPLTLDLGAVAKGLAIDLASRELAAFPRHAISAGGDLLLRGTPPGRRGWPVAVRDPRVADAVCRVIEVRDAAACTSGGYLRTAPGGERHHLLDGGSRRPARALLSATVVAPSAMLADALATAAFVLGTERALALVAAYGAEAVLVEPTGTIVETPGIRGVRA